MVDVDRSFHGAVPEPIDPREWGLGDTGATVASDTHAFAILAWEVKTKLIQYFTVPPDTTTPPDKRQFLLPQLHSDRNFNIVL